LHQVIKGLRDSGMAVLLATHDMDQAQTLCSRVGFLRDGILSPEGNPTHLLNAIFGGQEEILLKLRGKAPPHISRIFTRLRFIGDDDSLERRRLIRLTPTEQSQLVRILQDERLGVREVRIRKPGLESLFLLLNEAEDSQ